MAGTITSYEMHKCIHAIDRVLEIYGKDVPITSRDIAFELRAPYYHTRSTMKKLIAEGFIEKVSLRHFRNTYHVVRRFEGFDI